MPMKVIVADHTSASEENEADFGWYFLADSAVINTGKPFYRPEGKGMVKVALSGAIKINRLGKAISPRFASRYYSEIAPALHFSLPEYENILKEKGLPPDASRNFDKSLVVGDFNPIEENIEIELYLNGALKETFTLKNIKKKAEEVISAISEMNTLKMGDLVLPGMSAGFEVKGNDILEVKINGVEAFSMRVK